MSTVGNRFAYRERVRAYGEPVRPVEVTREGPPRSNKARVRWLEGEYEGLEEWVPKILLLAPWEVAEALLEEKRWMLEAVALSEEEGSDEVKWEARSRQSPGRPRAALDWNKHAFVYQALHMSDNTAR